MRIGYIGGQSRRLNERVIDNQWGQYLGEYSELVNIPAYSFIKLFGGSIHHWTERFPQSLQPLSDGLKTLAERYDVRTIYVNLPAIIPYLLMARSYGGLDLGLLFLAHSVGSEYWLKQWIAIAPWITERDVLLASTESSQKALLNISDQYRLARHIPLCIAMRGVREINDVDKHRIGHHLLSIGRIEDVKNIHLLLLCFAEMRKQHPDLHLTVAGEYTGQSAEQIEQYKSRLEGLVNQLDLRDSITFAGAVEGAVKDGLFQRSDVLINLSTDPGETFGFNLIEAKTWGLPVVCTNWDGFREIVVHESDGYLVDCDWEQDRPQPRLNQVIGYCLHLLQDEALRRTMSERAAAGALRFDYKRISPQIVQAVQEASECKISTMLETEELAMTRLSDLGRLYQLGHLRHFSFVDESLITIASNEKAEPLEHWMMQAKPIIGHFAGRREYAEL